MRLTLLSFTALVALLPTIPGWPVNSPLLDEYDYIGTFVKSDDQTRAHKILVVGGGPAGLTVANRLTEDPNITVLVLEAGQVLIECCLYYASGSRADAAKR